MTIDRQADVSWNGDLKTGSGEVKAGSGSFDFKVSFGKRFEAEPGTNPEELIAAAHAVCYSMALANTLDKAGNPPRRLQTRAVVSLDTRGAPTITRSAITVEGEVPGIDEERFREIADQAERLCPVSNALRGSMQITLDTKLTG
jgi:osmotically inducible protein OsmC